MKEASRRRCLRAMGVGAAGLASATAGCSALHGLTDGDGGVDYRPLVAHSGWFEPEESSLVPDEPNPQLVTYWDLAAIRALPDSLGSWSSAPTPGPRDLDAEAVRYAMTHTPLRSYFVEYADAESLRTAAMENYAYHPVPDVDGYLARVAEDTVTVVGDGSQMSVVRPEGERQGATDDELATAAARLHGARPSSFTAETERLERFERLFEALGPGTIGRFMLDPGTRLSYVRGDTFTVGSERAELRVAGIGDDMEPETLKRRELDLFGSAYDKYADLEATSSDGIPVLSGSTPTEDFTLLYGD